MTSPVISIIIPTRDRVEIIPRAIQSVLAQTFKDWEIIIVIDGLDQTNYEVLIKKNSSPNIHWYKQDQQGPGVARQNGYHYARGIWITFLDDDDYYMPHHLSNLIRISTKVPDYRIFRAGLIGINEKLETTRFPGYDNHQPTLLQYWTMPSNLTAIMFAREVIDRVPPDTIRTTVEDFSWMIRVLSHYNLFQLTEYSAVYVLHQLNRNNSPYGRRYLKDRLKAMETAYSYGQVSSIISKAKKRGWAHKQCLHFTRNSIIDDKWSQAAWGLKQSIKYLNWLSVRDYVYTTYFAFRHYIKRIFCCM